MLEGGTHKGFAANPNLDWRNTATARIRKGLAMLTKNLVSGGQWHTQGFCKYLFLGLHFLATRTRTHARGFLQLAQKNGERGGHPIRFPFRFFHSPRPLDGIPHSGVKTAFTARLTPCLRLYHTSGNHAPKRRNRAKERSMPQQHTPIRPAVVPQKRNAEINSLPFSLILWKRPPKKQQPPIGKERRLYLEQV